MYITTSRHIKVVCTHGTSSKCSTGQIICHAITINKARRGQSTLFARGLKKVTFVQRNCGTGYGVYGVPLLGGVYVLLDIELIVQLGTIILSRVARETNT